MHNLNHIEKDLLFRLSQGSEVAFAKLFFFYKDKLYSFILHLTGSKFTAEDIVQEVFLKVWNNRSSLLGIENFNAYLFKMSYNQAINGLRRQSLGASILKKMAGEEITIANSDEVLAGKELRNLLRQVVDKLPPQQRRVFILSRNEGLKYEEIADRLKISVSTVRLHMIQALKTIRKFIIRSYPLAIVYCSLLLAELA